MPLLDAIGVEHHSQPHVVSITQSTELGTVYDEETIREIARLCRKHDMYLHMDGARISNAAVALDADLGDITGRLGVDILSLGGTKNGLMFGEAVVLFRPELTSAFRYIRKQGAQLASKMRFIAVQFEALFGSDLWRTNAAHANRLARELAAGLQEVSSVEIVYPVEANAVFARLPANAIRPVQNEAYFYVWDPGSNVVRLMLSFDSTADDVEQLIRAVQTHCG
jgi:threonine aldolase